MDAVLAVPSLGWEDQTWAIDHGLAENLGVGRRRALAASGSYRSAVPATIATWTPSLPADLAADVDEATRALVSFDNYAATLLGADRLEIGPISAVLLRTESASSSQIEQLTASARQLALAEIGLTDRANAKLIVANVRTMEAALALADRLDNQAILDLHRELRHDVRGMADEAGKYRTEPVWIGSSSLSPIGAEYVAPDFRRVPKAMADLVEFIARDDLPPLVHAAVAHAQFETIHPFVDGNGRTGRALVHAMMRHAGVVTKTIAPVSAGLLADLATYTAALTAYRAGDSRPIIEQFAAASRYAQITGERLVGELLTELSQARDRLRAAEVRPHATVWQVLPLLVSNPVVNTRFVVEALGISETTAQRALTQLANVGVLVEKTGHKRNRIWQHNGILQVLDDYAAAIRRD